MRQTSSRPRHFPKTAIIFPASFWMAMVINAVNLALVFYARERFQATPTQIGLLYGSYNLNYVLGCLLFKRILERVDPRICVLIATCGELGGLLGIYFSSNLVPAYFCQALCGLSTALFWPPLMGWLTEGYEGSRLGRITGLYNLCWSSGAIIGPLLAGFLGGGDSARPLRYCIAAYLLLLTFLAIGSRQYGASNKAKKPPQAPTAATAAKELSLGRATSMRYPCWFGAACAWATTGMLLNIYPIFAKEELTLLERSIGSMLFMRALAMTVAMSMMGFIKRWHFNFAQLIGGHLLLGLAVLGLGFSRNFILSTGLLAVCGMLAGHAYSNSMFHGVSGCAQRTFRMAIHEVVLSIGAVFGGVLSGQIYQRMGSRTLFICTAMFMLPAVLADLLWKRSQKS
jgi:MFS family permease